MVQIYTDTETLELMKQLKKETPDINFSKIFKEALKRETEEDHVEESRLMKLSNMLEEARFKEAQGKDKVKRILDEINKEQEKNNQEVQDLQDRKIIKKTKEEERFENIYNNILEFYPQIKDTAIIHGLAEEWVSIFDRTSFASLFDFMEDKGYEQKQ